MSIDKKVIDKVESLHPTLPKDKHYAQIMYVKNGKRGLSLKTLESICKSKKLKLEIKISKK